SATATDACAAITNLTSSDATPTTSGCTVTQVRTFTAVDGCGNSAITSRSVSWTADQTPPTFTGTYSPVTLGCNPLPTDITAALGSATATDACGAITNLTSSDATPTTSGCTVTQVRTFTAVDGCGNSAITSRSVSWTADQTPPTFTGTYSPVTLGCNPLPTDITAALGSATATDACGAITNLTSSDATPTTSGCTVTQVRTFTAVDGCGNSAITSRSVSWTADQTPPTFTGTYSPVTLGCNPLPTDITAALGSATATDACGAITNLTSSDATPTTSGCTVTQVRTFTAVDGCGNSAITSRSVSWTADQTPPTFTGTYSPVTLGCNPLPTDITAALGSATATDACGAITNLTSSDATPTTSGCTVTQVRTFTAVDGCGNSAITSRSVSWTADQTPPTFTGTYSPVTLGCNPLPTDITAALGSATATDACGAITNLTSSDATPTTSGCTVTQVRTFTAVDGCGNSATTSRSVSWTADQTPPTFTGTYSPVTLGCNPLPTDITAALVLQQQLMHAVL